MKKVSKRTWLAALCSAFLVAGGVFTACSDGSSGGGGQEIDPVPENDPSGIEIPSLEVTDAYSLSAGTLTAAYEDASLYIKFDAAPTVNRSASVKGDASATKAVKILKSDGTVVDTIYASSEQITSQATNDSYKTINVKDQLISVNGNAVVIKPHTALDASTAYYVTVDDGLFTGKVNGTAFAGISDATTFTFTTRAAPTISGKNITIGKDKNFSKIQTAFDYIAAQGNTAGDWTLEIDKGYYNERLSFAGDKVNITMEGVDEKDGDLGANTVIYWQNNNGKDGSATNDGWNPASRTRTAFLYEGGNLTLKHLTFANTISRSVVGKDGTQAEAFYYDAKGYLVAYDSSFKSHQDTLLLGNQAGRGWFYKCYIEGDTDFIWGYADVMLFEECEIRCLYDSAPAVTTHTSYIFASRTVQTNNANKGYVLFNSNITVDNGVTAYYGRNSGSDTQATVVFNTFSTIDSTLWFEGATKYDEDIEGVCAIGYKDFGNTYADGSAIDTANRREGCYGLNEFVAKREFGGRNAILNRGWNATKRKYEPTTTQWDLSDFETEFDATSDASKNMLFIEPTYVPYLEGGSASDAFAITTYNGTAVTDAAFSVDNADLATVSDAGVVTAATGKDGEVVLTATKGEAKGVARVVIIPQFVAATALTLNKTAAFEIDKDDAITLTATFTPADTTDQNIIWSSSDTNVLRVVGGGATGKDLTATVTGFGVGTATITATSEKTPSVSASVEITVNEVYAVRYLQESTGYSLTASIDHRDATIVANPVSYGFAGGVAVAELSEADKGWGNNGYKFTSSGTVEAGDGADVCWADFTIRAAGDIKLKAVTSDMYCSATSNLRGKVYVKVGDGEFVEKGEVAADAKAMHFDKQDITTEVASGKTVTVRVAIAMLEGKTLNKAVTGVIGGVIIYYDIEGAAVAFPGADGDYNIKDYATEAEKVGQFTAMADGSTADGMISWHNVKYHSEGYGLGINTEGATISIKVGGPSVISMVGSQWSGGSIVVTTSDSTVIASGSTKVSKDGDLVTFLYTGDAEDTVTITFSGTTYVGTINVHELTTEVAEVKSVEINGAETVSTAAPVTFTAAVEATYMASPEVTWKSSDEEVATVDSDGKVTGVKAGKVTITATSKFNTSVSDSVEVTITEEELKPVVGETYTYNFKDTSATDYTALTQGVAGTSTDTFVSWDSNWKYHGSTYGILNTAENATLSIKVAGNVVVGYSGYEASKDTFTVTDADDNVVVGPITAKTAKGGFNYFIYKGDATTLTIKTGSKKETYIAQLVVRPWVDEAPTVTGITIAGSKDVYLSDGTATYSAVVASEYFPNESVTWSVENGTGAATIDGDGVLTMTGAGTVTVTATSVATPSASGSLEVTISAEAAAFQIGTTYNYNFLGDDMATYKANTTGSSGFISWVMAGWQGDAYGYNVKTNNTITLSVTGSVKVSVSYTYNDAVFLPQRERGFSRAEHAADF